MAKDLRTLKRLVRELRAAKNNQTIKDLDLLADYFECPYEKNSANDNRIYYAPFLDLFTPRVNVGIPHHGKVKKPYVVNFIGMLEEIIDRIELIEKAQEEDRDD